MMHYTKLPFYAMQVVILIACLWIAPPLEGQSDIQTTKELPLAARNSGAQDLVTHKAHTWPVSSLVFACDGHTFASGASHDRVSLWDLSAPKPKASFRLFFSLTNDLSFSPDNKWLASLSRLECQVRLWDLSGGNPKEVSLPIRHTRNLDAMAFSPDGNTLATAGSKDMTVRLWDLTLARPDEKAVLEVRDIVHAVVFSSDGKTLASAEGYTTLRLWDLSGPKPRERGLLKADSEGFRSVVFTRDGKNLVEWEPTLAAGQQNAARNLTVRTWDLSRAKIIKEVVFIGQSQIGPVALAPDLKTLVTTDVDGRVVWWETDSGKSLRQWVLPSPANAIAFLPDGQRIATGSKDGTVSIIRLGERSK